MKNIKITLRNYRNIPNTNPVILEIGEGISFILGLNNIGKSNLLRFFYEFRGIVNTFDTVGGRSDETLPNGLFYSQVKNQKSTEKSIVFEAEMSGKKLVVNINPSSNSNLEQGSYRATRDTANEIWPPEDLKFIKSLFNKSIYIGAFRNAMFESSGNYFDIEIGSSFIQTWDHWAHGNDLSKNIKIRKLKDELRELFNFDTFDISASQDNRNLKVETDDGIFKLDELGGGISHFILVLGNALIQEPSFIFIDEPENSLHPKMQEIFVRILASKAKYGLIATSHSIGLARSVGSDRILTLNKEEGGRISLTNYGNTYKPSIINTISELSFSQFMEMGGNNVLLVEGSTDVKCFREILRKYNIEQHFVIIDLGGSNGINPDRFEELQELTRLQAKSYSIIFDSEISAEGEPLKQKFQDFIKTCESLKFNVFSTDVHSTDNYITQEAINKEIGSSYTALGKYESLTTRSPEHKWGKSLNWKMFREMRKSDFAGTGLDNFITEILIPLTQ